MKNKSKNIFLFLLLLFLVDRLTKYLSFELPQEGLFYLPKIGLKFYLNQGVAFSLPLPQILIVIVSVIIIIILTSLWLKSYQTSKTMALWPLSLVIIGTLSNLIDRLRFQAVVDFIDLWFWPAFNLADCYIVIGVIWLILLLAKNKEIA